MVDTLETPPKIWYFVLLIIPQIQSEQTLLTQDNHQRNPATVGVNNQTNVSNFVILEDVVNSNICKIHFILDSKLTLDNTGQIDNVNRKVLTYSQSLLCCLYIYSTCVFQWKSEIVSVIYMCLCDILLKSTCNSFYAIWWVKHEYISFFWSNYLKPLFFFLARAVTTNDLIFKLKNFFKILYKKKTKQKN